MDNEEMKSEETVFGIVKNEPSEAESKDTESKDTESKDTESKETEGKASAEFTVCKTEGESKEKSYEQIIKELTEKVRELEDYQEISKVYPSVRSYTSLAEMPNSKRYFELRSMGASAIEAIKATDDTLFRTQYGASSDGDSKEHITSVMTKSASSGVPMSREEYETIKAVFGDELSDERIAELYRRIK